ncbi:MAG: uncharacterized protein A8A55_3531, partial [Amphiamblys sp. WSBS2006]
RFLSVWFRRAGCVRLETGKERTPFCNTRAGARDVACVLGEILSKTCACVPLVFLLELHAATTAPPMLGLSDPSTTTVYGFEFPTRLCPGLAKTCSMPLHVLGMSVFSVLPSRSFVFEAVHLKHLCISVLCRASFSTVSAAFLAPPL